MPNSTILLQCMKSADGPLRLFAALQDDARNGRISGRSSGDAAGTAAPDPSRTPSVHRSARDNIDLSEEQGAVRD
jgi:hypothetical protein